MVAGMLELLVQSVTVKIRGGFVHRINPITYPPHPLREVRSDRYPLSTLTRC